MFSNWENNIRILKNVCGIHIAMMCYNYFVCCMYFFFKYSNIKDDVIHFVFINTGCIYSQLC